jgi:hypothetical protein
MSPLLAHSVEKDFEGVSLAILIQKLRVRRKIDSMNHPIRFKNCALTARRDLFQ